MRSLRLACLLALAVLGVFADCTASPAQNAAAPWQPDLHWRIVGPFRGGRTRAASGVPGQPNVFYVGQVDG